MKCIIKDCSDSNHQGASRCTAHEVSYLKEQADYWHSAWAQQKASMGIAFWIEYYKGVQDHQDGKIYDPAFGRKVCGLKLNTPPDRTEYNKQLCKSLGRN